MSDDGLYLGIGTCDGYAKVINNRFVEVECAGICHDDDFPSQSVAFTSDSRYLVSVSPFLSYNFLPNVRPQGLFAKVTKWWVLIMILVYLCMKLKDGYSMIFKWANVW